MCMMVILLSATFPLVAFILLLPVSGILGLKVKRAVDECRKIMSEEKEEKERAEKEAKEAAEKERAEKEAAGEEHSEKDEAAKEETVNDDGKKGL